MMSKIRIFDKELFEKDMKSKRFSKKNIDIHSCWTKECDGKEAIQDEKDEETYKVNGLYSVIEEWTREVETMTIIEYMKQNKETYRSLAHKLGISHTYLCNIAKHNECISEKLANKIHKLLPQVDIEIRTEKKYYLAKEHKRTEFAERCAEFTLINEIGE